MYYIYIYTNFNVYTPIVYTCIFPAECAILYTISKQINCWHSLLPMIRGSQNAPCPGCLGYTGDDKLPSYSRGCNKANISIPIEQSFLMECHKSFPMLSEVLSRLSQWGWREMSKRTEYPIARSQLTNLGVRW